MKCKNILHTSINTAIIHTIHENMKCKNILHTSINPLVPSAHKSVRIAKISILKLEGIIKKISYTAYKY